MNTRLKLAIICVVILVVAGSLFLAYHSGSTNPTTAPKSSTDSNTTKQSSYNEDPLINNGVTSGQLGNLEQVLDQYLSAQDKAGGQVGFTSIKRAPPDPAATTSFTEITFIVQLNNKNAYSAKLDSYSSTEIRLYLYTLENQTLLYDSQNVGGASI